METGIFVTGILIAAAGLVYGGYGAYQKIVNDKKTKNTPMTISVVIGIVLIILSQCFTIIPTGTTGVKTTFGQVSENVARPGLNLKVPFFTTIEQVNNKQQDITLAKGKSKLYAEVKGKIPVTATNLTITYNINPARSAWIYSNVTDYESGLIKSSLVSSALKASTVTLDVNEVTIRSIIEPLVTQNLQALLDEKYGVDTVIITRVVIGNMDFEKSYNDAINEKNMAQQEYEQAMVKNRQELEKAENDAKVKTTAAQGKADAAKIEAEGIAEANRKITESLNNMILANNWIIKWDGKVPVVTDGNGNMIDISKLLEG